MTDDKQLGVPETELDVLTQALLWALLTGASQPYPIPPIEVRKIATMLLDCGVRQTDDIAENIELPGWVKEQVRSQGEEVAPTVDHQAPQETPRVRTAPTCPKKIPRKNLGVIG